MRRCARYSGRIQPGWRARGRPGAGEERTGAQAQSGSAPAGLATTRPGRVRGTLLGRHLPDRQPALGDLVPDLRQLLAAALLRSVLLGLHFKPPIGRGAQPPAMSLAGRSDGRLDSEASRVATRTHIRFRPLPDAGTTREVEEHPIPRWARRPRRSPARRERRNGLVMA